MRATRYRNSGNDADTSVSSPEDTSPNELSFHPGALGLEGLDREIMPLVEGVADRRLGTAQRFDAYCEPLSEIQFISSESIEQSTQLGVAERPEVMPVIATPSILPQQPVQAPAQRLAEAAQQF
jgi:hypothetical protein